MTLQPTIELTEDGSQTLRHPLLGQTFHSSRGAVGESMHVFVGQGFDPRAERADGRAVRVLELGFGSGLNCLLTARRAQQIGVGLEYCAMELYPLTQSVWGAMGYMHDPLFSLIHNAPWGMAVEVAEGFVLHKIEGDMASMQPPGEFDVIYMDAFAPDVEPGLWTEEFFGRIYRATAPQGVLVTYSAKGAVRRALSGAGYSVERTQGALGKRHMLRAFKTDRHGKI